MTEPIKTGKVRSLYKRGYNVLQMVATNRCTAFDRYICDIPQKGEMLNRMSAWWFQRTASICPNHYLGSYGSSMFVKECTPFMVEVVVRGYMTGSTATSLWTHYKRESVGSRGLEYCGHYFPPGLYKHCKLPQNVVTPTTKSDTHDEPISAGDVVTMGLMTEEEWRYVERAALELFSFGQWEAARRGLVLVDTKYEFGKDAAGNILLIDELHTCDSSRYWLGEPAEGEEPQKLDKDAIRDWVRSQCDPYTVAEIPKVPVEVIDRVQRVYQNMCERLTGESSAAGVSVSVNNSPNDENHFYWEQRHDNMVVVIAGSKSDSPAMDKLSAYLWECNVYHRVYFASAHKQPRQVLEILDRYNAMTGIVYITCAGMSNALSGFVAANTGHPVIAHPVYKDQTDMLVNVHSTLQMPSNVPAMTVLGARNAALAAMRILNA